MNILRRGLACLAVLALAVFSGEPGAAEAEPRVALVIGNAAYASSPLANPVNDARAMAKSLRDTGFTVVLMENIGYKAMGNAMRDFGRDLAKTGGVGLFFYAGHGMQVKGRNYLIPVDADMQHEDDIPFNAVDANYVLDKMESARNRLNLVILDACRNNPFARAFRASAKGLTQMEAPSGTLIAFATAPGAVAGDGDGGNGIYTRHLLRAMAVPGLLVEQVFKQVRVGVMKDTGNLQVPWESSSLKGDFYFRTPPAAPIPASVPSADSSAFELAFWDSIKQSTDAADFQAYLDQFPDGKFVRLAQSRQARLKEVPKPTATVPAPASVPVPAATAKPVVGLPKAGDRWVYEVVDNYRKSVVATYAVRVQGVQDEAVAEIVTTELDTLVKERRYGLDDVFGADTFRVPGKADVQIVEFAPYALARNKFQPGRKWEGVIDYAGSPCAGTVTVVGDEAVKTPAGEFPATRVRIDCRLSFGLRFGLPVIVDVWYAQDARRFVRMERKVGRGAYGGGDDDVIQLKRFSLN
ncbi:MAG: caspase family protein [Candidatus Nitricoxidivorans perseverans]|uniref:Caspase family protein n=1 Tax=Candidatus Nitricoxidivorans perseverans TaxID=2975601 RepID=A0AA49FKV5_9PROT|nr:MAG: caspase family protein [Candidatus Nitricoxidivorans perseverans]